MIEKGFGAEIFDEDYFEHGVAKGKSGYTNYQWMPELTIPFAHKIIKYLGLRDGEKVLDYGCAKGFMVHALRLLDMEAYGCDISPYTIHKDPMQKVKPYLSLIEQGGNLPYEDGFFDVVLAKDVFEHLEEGVLEKTLGETRRVSDKMFVIVPLGDGERYVVPSYEHDVTHIHRQPHTWWQEVFEENGWHMDQFSFLVRGMKQNYADFKKGNGFFTLTRED